MKSTEDPLPGHPLAQILHIPKIWVAVKEFNLSYHNPEATLFGTYPYYGNLN